MYMFIYLHIHTYVYTGLFAADGKEFKSLRFRSHSDPGQLEKLGSLRSCGV